MDNNELQELRDSLRAMGVTRAQILWIAALVFFNFCVAVAFVQGK